MDKDLIKEKAEFLRDVSLQDWKLIQLVVDRTFENKIAEIEKGLKLRDCNDVDVAIRSIFG